MTSALLTTSSSMYCVHTFLKKTKVDRNLQTHKKTKNIKDKSPTMFPRIDQRPPRPYAREKSDGNEDKRRILRTCAKINRP
jgi:hypothetical protein